MESPKFRTVKEALAGGEDLRERYFGKSIGDDKALNASVPEMDIVAIDLGLLASSATSGTDEMVKLRSALTTCGVVQILNHGVTKELLDKVQEITKQFFALPTEEKQKYARQKRARDMGCLEGYAQNRSVKDVIRSDGRILEWSDRLYLVTYPEDQRRLKFWPEKPVAFRETLHEYTKKLRQINEQLMKAMARSLDIDENCFLKMYGDQRGIMFSRFNFYPPFPSPDKVLGVKPHADGSTITILLPEREVEGLQFLKDDRWFKAPALHPGALLVNVGDQIEIMSNGIYKSPVHRVVTNREKPRTSLATFCVPAPDQKIQPASDLVDKTRPRLYKTVQEYVSVFVDYYHQGRRSIETAKLSERELDLTYSGF